MPEILRISHRIVVSGRANIFLSGQPVGTAIGRDVRGPREDPQEAPREHRLHEDTRHLQFFASGRVFYSRDPDSRSNANGMGDGHGVGPENGIGRLHCRNNTLVGVLLTDERPEPGGEPDPPTVWERVEHSSRHWGVLRRPFGIGVGPTFVRVPPEATRLFLGAFDTHGANHDNQAEFYVAVIEYSD